MARRGRHAHKKHPGQPQHHPHLKTHPPELSCHRLYSRRCAAFWAVTRRRRTCATVKEGMSSLSSSSRRTAFLGYGACALAGSLWGTGFYFGRLALNEMSVESMVLYRFLFASLGVLPAALMARAKLSREGFRLLLLSAFLGIPVQFLLQFHGLALTTVSHAALMVGSMPVLLAVAAALFAGERLDVVGWAALVASTVGAGLVVLGAHRSASAPGGPSLTGDLLVVFSLCTALGWILASKKLMRETSPTVVSSYTILTGTAMLIVCVLGRTLLNPLLSHKLPLPPVSSVSLTAWSALAISGLACTATTTLLWNWGIHRVPASRAGVFLNLEPVIGSVLGVTLLGEHLGPHAWSGGALILGSAVVLTARGGHEEQATVVLE